ncbi:unnamed protein product, partial [Heterosigma akashiwo]
TSSSGPWSPRAWWTLSRGAWAGRTRTWPASARGSSPTSARTWRTRCRWWRRAWCWRWCRWP